MNNLHDIKIDGISTINGGKYRDINIDGIATLLSEIEGDHIDVDGIAKVKGNIKCRTLCIDGKFKSLGSVEVEEDIRINGMVTIEGDLQGREAKVDGNLSVNGLFSADRINMILAGRNRIREIGGEVISIFSAKKEFWNLMMFSNKLISELIEGDEITLENTECDIIRGHNVTIREGCNIKRVEYTGEITIDERSKVNDIVKLYDQEV